MDAIQPVNEREGPADASGSAGSGDASGDEEEKNGSCVASQLTGIPRHTLFFGGADIVVWAVFSGNINKCSWRSSLTEDNWVLLFTAKK